MALKLEDVAKPETLIVSAGLALLWRFVFPVAGAIIGPAVRPIAKAAIKGGIVTANWVTATSAGARQAVEDIATEAVHESHQREAASRAEGESAHEKHPRPRKAEPSPTPPAPSDHSAAR